MVTIQPATGEESSVNEGEGHENDCESELVLYILYKDENMKKKMLVHP